MSQEVKMKISKAGIFTEGKTIIYHSDIEPAIANIQNQVSIHKQRLMSLEHGTTQWLEEFKAMIELQTYVDMMYHLLGE